MKKKTPAILKSANKTVTEAVLEKKLDARFEKLEDKIDKKLHENNLVLSQMLFKWSNVMKDDLKTDIKEEVMEAKNEILIGIDRIAGRIDDHDANDIIRDNDMDELEIRVKRLEHAKN